MVLINNLCFILETMDFRDLFFFSSRRRHTRLTCDWSSDVCSSDLRSPGAGRSARGQPAAAAPRLDGSDLERPVLRADLRNQRFTLDRVDAHLQVCTHAAYTARSEERRVGNECGARWAPAPGREEV